MNTKENQKDKMLKAIDAWKQSGLKQNEFCRRQGITYSSFYYWLAKSKKKNSASFITLNNPLALDKMNSTYVEVIGLNGNIIRFYQTLSADFLEIILKG